MFKKIMLIFVSLVMCLCVVTQKVSASTEGKCGDNVYWSYDDGVLTISGEGDMYDCDSDIIWDIDFMEDIHTINIQEGVTSIGNRMFIYLSKLETINIPKTVEKIGYEVFEECYNLTNICVDSENQYYCRDSNNILYTKDMSTLILCPPGFEGSTYIIPETVKTISDSAFSSVSVMSLTVPDSVSTIGDYAFENCSNLKEIKIGANVKTIGEGAFRNCSSLTNIALPESTESIGENAFKYCDSLRSIVVDPNSQSFKDDKGVLYNKSMTNLICCPINFAEKSYTILDGVTRIEDYAFENCEGLENVSIPESVSSIGDYAFYRCSLKNINLPKNVTSIGRYAFYGCEFTSIVIPEGVTTIGDAMFRGCSELKSITLPETLTSIGNNSFVFCNSLKNIVIPKNVKSIGVATFYAYDGAIYFNGDAPEFADNAFVYSNIKAYYPKDNETWTQDKLKKYESYTIEWIAYDPEFPLIDVNEVQWYYPWVKEAYNLGLMTGATETLFKPNANMNRGMVAIVFHRMEGSEPIEYSPVFKDVPNKQYYTTSVLWMKAKGIINGYTDGTFKPLRNVSREEMATMIFNFAKYKGLNVKSNKDITYFNDYAKITPYARVTIAWAVENGLMSGKDNGVRLDPLGHATRAECAKMLVQAYKVIYNK